MTREELKEQIDELLEVVNLTGVAYKKIGGFSGGMKQRVLLAQALLGDPDILILDEPQKMGNEDSVTQKALKRFDPLFSINYSATHKKQHNLVYVLDALDAYNKKLVKKIEVKGFETDVWKLKWKIFESLYSKRKNTVLTIIK